MSGNEGLAFGLVVASGAATFLGALGVLFTRDHLDMKFLSCSLAISAGVMIYVSFVEIFCLKANESFIESGQTKEEARRSSSLLFFSGIAITFVLDQISHKLGSSGFARCVKPKGTGEEGGARGKHGAGIEEAVEIVLAEETEDVESLKEKPKSGKPTEVVPDKGGKNREDLQQAGFITALAIGLHNFPEGLATYMATMADSSAGIAVAMAIALHNIPEGLAVAVPVYYSSGRKWKGIFWGIMSGMSEPLGGLFGYLILRGTDMNPVTYGILFALVAGMMVYISIAELLPQALAYESETTAIIACFFGMGVMAASLILFEAEIIVCF